MPITSGLVFLALLNFHSFTYQGVDTAHPGFSETGWNLVLSGRATIGDLNTYSFDPLPYAFQLRGDFFKKGSPLGVHLNAGLADPFYGSGGLYLKSLYASWRLKFLGTLEARGGWISLPFQSDAALPFAFRSAGMDYRGKTVLQRGLGWYDLPVDFVPEGGLGAAFQHRFDFGVELGGGFSFLPMALYGQAAWEYRKSDVFFRPGVKAMLFKAADVSLSLNELYEGSGAPATITADAGGMSLLEAGLLAGVGSVFAEVRFGWFSCNKDDFATADGLAGNWGRAGGGLVIRGKEHKFLQSLVLRADFSWRKTGRDGEDNIYIAATASAVVLRRLELTASLAARFPEMEGVDPKSYVYFGAGYTLPLAF